MSSTVCGHQTCVAYPKTGQTTARYKVRQVRWLDISKAHLRKNPSSLLALAHFSVTCLVQVKSLDIQTPKSFSAVVTSSGLPASCYECPAWLHKGGAPSTARRSSPKLSINEHVKCLCSQSNNIPNVNPLQLKQMNSRIKVCQVCRGHFGHHKEQYTTHL